MARHLKLPKAVPNCMLKKQPRPVCSNRLALQQQDFFVLFLTEEAYSHGGLQTRELVWVTNVSTSPNWY